MRRRVRVRVRVWRWLRYRRPPTGLFNAFAANPVTLLAGLFNFSIILLGSLATDGSINADIQRKGGLIGSNTSKS